MNSKGYVVLIFKVGWTSGVENFSDLTLVTSSTHIMCNLILRWGGGATCGQTSPVADQFPHAQNFNATQEQVPVIFHKAVL